MFTGLIAGDVASASGENASDCAARALDELRSMILDGLDDGLASLAALSYTILTTQHPERRLAAGAESPSSR